MSKKILTLALLLMLASSLSFAGIITSSSDPALSGGTVITFESATAGHYTSLDLSGVNFASSQGFEISSAYAGQYNTSGQSLQNPYDTSDFGTLTFTFSSAVSAFGFNWGASDTQWTLTAYDSSNNVIETYLLPITASSNAGDFVGLSEGSAVIAYATLVGDSSDYVFVDNFTYSGSGTAPVPEPSSLMLLATGGAGMLGAIRRKLGK